MKRKDSRTKEILKFLAVGSGVLVLSFLDPSLPTKLLAAYLRKKKFQRGLFIRDLRRLQQRELIDYHEESGGSIKIILKKKGRVLTLQYKFEELRIKRPRRWDGKWRLVLFDIPHLQKQARDALRGKLKQLGFYQLQKSVFIYPFSCENEIDFICEIFGIRRYILFMTIPKFEGSEKLEHYFQIGHD